MKKTIIQREDGKDYLIRWTLFTCRWFSIKLHKILISDDDCLHDHPWAFISILLKGSYIEHRRIGYIDYKKKYRAGNILYRHLHSIHRLEIDKPVTSLVITFRKKKTWGFYTKKGWVHWREYKTTGACES